jgi:hypothetical protein
VAHDIPAITGKQLVKLLLRGGWEIAGRSRHGCAMTKVGEDGRKRITVVPDKRSPLPAGTLGAILGPKQTGLGRQGLSQLIAEHGLK